MEKPSRTRAPAVVCALQDVRRPTFDTVDALARLRVDAARLAMGVRLVGVSPELRELLSLAGLLERFELGSGVEPQRQAEEREESLRVEEEGDPGDAIP
jgi:anti-anti-sigma regulatory factor